MTTELQILIAFLMICANAFFVGAEFGLVSARRSNIELAALEGSRAAKITLGAMERVSIMLAGAQLGITVSSLIFGAIGEPLLAHYLEQPFAAMGVPEQLLHPIAFVIALALMTYVHVVIGEMVPKNLALAGPTKAALWLAPPLVVFVRFTSPIVHGLNAIANATLQLFGVKPRDEIVSSFNRDEVAGFVKESRKEGLLSKDAEHLLSGALTFERRTITRVLLPVNTLVTAPLTASPQDIEDLVTQTGHSRFPLTNLKGELTGYIHLKDLLTIAPSKQHDKLAIRLVRELPKLKANTTLRNALFIMQQQGAHLAKVVDKNKTLGVVALEDVLEELVGRIRDDA
jgi:CBS domain containing-hemolysin-like protein